MRESEIEHLLAECVEEYHQRRALGEPVGPEDWRDRLGEHFAEFQQIILSASAFDELIHPTIQEEKFPRTWGQYHLLRVLGRGTMGTVYEAVDRKLDRVVALKVLRHGFDHEPVAVERFKREARACARIQHDHVITILEYGVHEGRPFYAMPLIAGKSLLDLVREGNAPEPGELARGLAGVADALSVLHDVGIIHRDVKPGNIMVEESGRMVLADFGLARTAATLTLTQTGQAMGTPLYMSPEQLLGQRNDIDERTDIYGLGVTMYEALAGRPPFHPVDQAALMRMILTEQPESLRSAAPDAPVELSNIAMTAMEKGKGDRYQTAKAMRDDLLAYAAGQPVAGRPVSRLRRAWRESRWATLMVASVILLAAVAWWLVPEPDGALKIWTEFAVMAQIDGKLVGQTPVDHPVRPGTHRIVLSRDGFDDQELEVDVAPGEIRSLVIPVRILDGEDPRILAEMCDHLGLRLLSDELPKVMRGVGDEPAIQVLYPRGRVRVADLTQAVVELNSIGYEIDGVVELRLDGKVLFRAPMPKVLAVEPVAIPESVRAQLSPGDEPTWGYYPGPGTNRGPKTEVQFRIVADPVVDRFKAIERRIAKLESPPAVVERHLKTQVLFDAELYTAAYLMALETTRVHPDSPRGYYLQMMALRRMGIEDGWLQERLGEAFQRVDPDRKSLLVPEGN